MTSRIKTALDRPTSSKTRGLSQNIENGSNGDISVRNWSNAAIEQMFEAAEQALKERTSDQDVSK